DSDNVRSRSRNTGALSTAVTRRMALEMACEYTAYDFALDPGARHLFPKVDRALVPSGNAAAPDQKPILDNLQWLHERLCGEQVSGNDDPELQASYQLLSDLQKQGAADVGAGRAPKNLVDPCAARLNYATGQPLPMNQQFSADPQYVVRAWQGLITYLLMD